MSLQQFLPGWETVCELGHGSHGTVYEIERKLPGCREQAALKVISIPSGASKSGNKKGNQSGPQSFTDVEEQLSRIVSEYTLVRRLNGNTNIVNCDDIHYAAHEGDDGYDIAIRMELLTPLTLTRLEEAKEGEVIRLGMDMCRALIACEQQGILHRDIKPGNIFVTESGNYKLGDFGIATKAFLAGEAVVGTIRYMAPEVFCRGEYSAVSDLYSLGLVLYQMLNDGMLPFEIPCIGTPEEFEQRYAYEQRMQGKRIPSPGRGSRGLKRIIRKLLAYAPEERYQTAQQVLHALEKLKHQNRKLLPVGIILPGVALFGIAGAFLLGQGRNGAADVPLAAVTQEPSILEAAEGTPAGVTPASAVETKMEKTQEPAPTVTPIPTPVPTPEPTPNPEPVIRLVNRSPEGERTISEGFVSSLKVGDMVAFGYYEQDRNQKGAEPICWNVLAAENGKYLLISEKVLAAKQYHTVLDKDIGWGKSEIRYWLNMEFYQQAFSQTERAHILNTVSSKDNDSRHSDEKVTDRVFLLTYSEMHKYMKNKEDRIAALADTVNPDSIFGYWTRSVASGEASIVYVDGATNYGSPVDGTNGVRAAVWISLDAVMNADEQEEFVREYEHMLSESTIWEASVGQVVSYGTYNCYPAEFGTEPIKWIVLEKDSESVLLLSEKILEYKSINMQHFRRSLLYHWLNGEFYETAFSRQERYNIVPIMGTDGEETWAANVSLLSEMELELYLPDAKDRLAGSTLYAQSQLVNSKGIKYWALQTVRSDGKRLKVANEKGEVTEETELYVSEAGVRPCIRVKTANPAD